MAEPIIHTDQSLPAATAAGLSDHRAVGVGLSTTTALVVGSIIGAGIFDLATSLSSHGPINLLFIRLTWAAALALAMLFAALSRRLPGHGRRTRTRAWPTAIGSDSRMPGRTGL